jgi:hypothetical protein
LFWTPVYLKKRLTVKSSRFSPVRFLSLWGLLKGKLNTNKPGPIAADFRENIHQEIAAIPATSL